MFQKLVLSVVEGTRANALHLVIFPLHIKGEGRVRVVVD
jgi:hypothetical protein